MGNKIAKITDFMCLCDYFNKNSNEDIDYYQARSLIISQIDTGLQYNKQFPFIYISISDVFDGFIVQIRYNEIVFMTFGDDFYYLLYYVY